MPQGTIKTHDPRTRSGVLLDDDRNELHYDPESYEGSGVRYFRIGQRVKFQVVGEGDARRVRNLTIVTL